MRTRRYGLAFVAVMLVLSGSLAFEPLFGAGDSGLLLLLAVAVTARLAGRGPALLATGLAAAGAWMFFTEPRYSIHLLGQRDAGNLLLLVITGITVSLLGAAGMGAGSVADFAGRVFPSRDRVARFRRIGLMACLLSLLLAMSFTLARDMEQERELRTWASRLFEVLERCRRLTRSYEAANTTVRDYLLTGNPADERRYAAAVSAGERHLESLLHFTTGDLLQQSTLEQLSRLAAASIIESNSVISLAHEGRRREALQLLTGDARNRTMSELRGALDAVQREERHRLAQRAASSRVQGLRMRWVLGLGSGSLLLLLFVAGAIIERDIAEREATRRALHENEERLRIALAGANAGAWEWDLATGRLVWSDELWRLYGLTPGSQPTYAGWLQVVHPGDRARVEDELSKALGSSREFHLEHRVVDPGGTVRWVMARGQPEHDEDGIVRHYLGIALDISERKRTEQAVRESEARLAFVLQASRIGHWEFSLSSHKTHRSLEHAQIFGYSDIPPDWALEDFLSHVVPEDRDTVASIIRASMDCGANMNFECRIRRADGAIRWVWVCGQMRSNADGSDTRLGGIIQDITERKLAETRIQQLNAELEQKVQQRTAELQAANKELEAFAYSVSHDLRAPLRGIDGWSLALLEDYGSGLDQRAHEYLSRVRAETQRLGRLIDDLLQLSRITRGQMQRTVVDLSALAEGVAQRLLESNATRQIEFSISPGLTAAGDARLLEIALTNLLGNAVKFTTPRDQARIEFDQTISGGETVFCVRDNGVGFDMAYARTLFGAFQRLHRASDFPGTGIGLATVSRIIRRHGGRIWAEAGPDQGAAFFFTAAPRNRVDSNE
ncbi:MAG: PAS domain-containing protein [Bryobacterales bacterium]|nr:PAS domain-containing protein [Bryobacterales bacterium]